MITTGDNPCDIACLTLDERTVKVKTLKTLLCGMSLLAFVVSPAVFADEHPGTTAPTTGAAPTTEPSAQAPAPEAKEMTTAKPKMAKKDKKAKKMKMEEKTNN